MPPRALAGGFTEATHGAAYPEISGGRATSPISLSSCFSGAGRSEDRQGASSRRKLRNGSSRRDFRELGTRPRAESERSLTCPRRRELLSQFGIRVCPEALSIIQKLRPVDHVRQEMRVCDIRARERVEQILGERTHTNRGAHVGPGAFP